MAHFTAFVGPAVAVLLAAACAPLPEDEAAEVPTTLTWSADEGNGRIYSTNSNVALHLVVSRALNGNATRGNITIAAGRSGDTVTPTTAKGTENTVAVALRVAGAGTGSISAALGTQSAVFEVPVAAPDPSRTTLTFEPNAVIAGDQPAMGTVWAKDGQGRSLSGLAVTITSDDPNAIIRPNPAVTQGTGLGVFSVVGHTTGTQKIAVAGEGLGLHEVLTIKPGGIDLTQSSVILSPATLPADGVAQATVQILVRDAHDNPIEGIGVTLTPSGPESVLADRTGTTDATGTFATHLTCTAAKVVSVVAELRPKSSSTVRIRGTMQFVAP